MSPAKATAKRWRPSVRTLLTLAAILAVGIALARFAHTRSLPDLPDLGAGPAPATLRATTVDAHITGRAPTVCRPRTSRDGRPLPDRGCTPGVLNAAVNQNTLDATICRPGYASTLLPPDAETGAALQKLMGAYDIPHAGAGDYELDHLVSLDLGGGNDTGNLWPERNDHPAGAANSKDRVESALNLAVCSHKTTLAAAQKAIATDWTTALATLGLPALR